MGLGELWVWAGRLRESCGGHSGQWWRCAVRTSALVVTVGAPCYPAIASFTHYTYGLVAELFLHII
jgi:hypothetical protein